MSEAGNGAGKASGGIGWPLALLTVLLLVAGGIWLAVAPPPSLVTPKVVAKLQDASGMEVRVAGAQRYALLPRFTLHLEDVTFSPRGGGDPVMRATSLDAVMPTAVAFGGKGDILSVSLVKPVIKVVKAAAKEGAPPSAAPVAAAGAPLVIQSITVADGTVSVSDGKSGGLELTGLDAKSTMDPVTGAMTAEGKAAYREEPVAFEITAADGRKLLAGDSTEVKAKLDSRGAVKLGFAGKVSALSGEADGDVTLSAPSSKDIAKLLGKAGPGETWEITGLDARSKIDAKGALSAEGKAAWRGEPVTFEIATADSRKLFAGEVADVKAKLDTRGAVKAGFAGRLSSSAGEADGEVTLSAASSKDIARLLGVGTDVFLGEGAVSLAAKAKASSAAIALRSAEVGLGKSRATADLDVALGGARPAAKGSIAWKELDLTALAPPPPAPRAAAAAPEAAAPAGEGIEFEPGYASLGAALTAIEKGGSESPRGAAPEAAAAAPASEWSDAPLDLARLGSIDADVMMKAEKVRVAGLTLANGEGAVKIDGGKLAIDMKRLEVAKGQASGKVALDANKTEPHADIDVTVKGVAAGEIMTQVVGRPFLSGPTDARARLAAKGKSVRQIVSSLDGQVDFAFGKGAIEGFDIPQIVKNIWSGWSYDKTKRTTFQRLEGQYAVKKGVAQSEKDAAFDGDAIDITASGKVSAPARTLDQKLKLKMTESGWTLPIYLTGKWDKLKGGLDWGGLFASPQSYTSPAKLSADPKAAAAAMPADVRQQIERELAKSPQESRLKPEARQMLKELVGQTQ